MAKYLPSQHMTKYRPRKPEEGDFGPVVNANTTCGRCRSAIVVKKRWVSKEGDFIDERFECHSCGYFWWVEDVTRLALAKSPSLNATEKQLGSV